MYWRQEVPVEIIDIALIERIRKALIKRYDRDQQIQQMIEEIGAEEGLNESELAIVYQAYLEVKERMQYTANLMELWNQIEVVQDRMSMLNSYESLERDLFGDVLSFDKPMGYGASNQDNLDYTMEQIKLHDIDHDLEDIDDESTLDRDIHTSLDPYDMVNSLLYSKQSGDDTTKTKQQKEIDKLIKKQLKRVEEEWAKLSGKKNKKDKKKKDKKLKKDKESKLDKEFKKNKKDKDSKKAKKDKDFKKGKDKQSKKDKKAKKLEKALKKESKKSTKKD